MTGGHRDATPEPRPGAAGTHGDDRASGKGWRMVRGVPQEDSGGRNASRCPTAAARMAPEVAPVPKVVRTDPKAPATAGGGATVELSTMKNANRPVPRKAGLEAYWRKSIRPQGSRTDAVLTAGAGCSVTRTGMRSRVPSAVRRTNIRS